MHRRMRKAMIIILWLAVWQIAAVLTDNAILLVGPVQVLAAFAQNIVQPDFVTIIMHSLARIGSGFFLAFFLGAALGAASCRFPVVEEIAEPVVQTLKSVPVASFVVILLIWFGSGRLSFFISLLIVFPNVYVSTIAGLKSADEKLLEMAQVFAIGKWNRFLYIYRPALMPYWNSSLKVSLGMSWKSGVAAEVIGLPDFSLGERLYVSKIYLDTAGLFAWTLTIILLSYFFEKAVLWMTGRVGAWKPYPGPGRWNAKDTGGKLPVEAGTIRVSHISKSYCGQLVLEDCSLTLESGRRYLLMAPSGSGKTTLLRILTGLDHADAGKVTGMSSNIGMVFQEDRLCEEYDVICNIMMCAGKSAAGCQNRKKTQLTQTIMQEVEQILPKECVTKSVNELSGGMRRRVALLRAVLSEGDVLILDEPFAGLDEENRNRCGEYILEHLRGRTLLVTTHREEDVKLLQGEKLTLPGRGIDA